MDFLTLVRILNRLLDNGVSFKKAYYGVFGDNPEAFICNKLYNTGAFNRKLGKALLRYTEDLRN